MSEMVERLAPLVYAAMWPGNDPAVPWSTIQNEAAKAPVYEATRAIISAMREPTEAMVAAAEDSFDAPWWFDTVFASKAWPAAIDAAIK